MLSPAITGVEVHPGLAWAHPLIQEWFTTKFGTPTEPQIEGWPSILRGEATLISAPTGSGKTLAAFLVCIDGLLRAALEGRLEARTHVVYVSPLKALSNDIQKNLDGPLREIQQLAGQRGYLCPEIRTGVRTGDTLAKDRASMLRVPPHILVTTPESLYILLTAGKPRQNLTRVHTVIVDEIHADRRRQAWRASGAVARAAGRAGVRGESPLCLVRCSPACHKTAAAYRPLCNAESRLSWWRTFLTGSHESRCRLRRSCR